MNWLLRLLGIVKETNDDIERDFTEHARRFQKVAERKSEELVYHRDVVHTHNNLALLADAERKRAVKNAEKLEAFFGEPASKAA